MIGHLHLLWWWCMDYAMDGDLSRYNDQQIADAAEWKGDPKKFTEALVGAGLLDGRKGGDGGRRYLVHDWLDFCGELIHKRLRRKEEKRQKSADIVRRDPPKVRLPDPTLPDPTRPDLTRPTQTPGAALPPRAFEKAWERYPSKTGQKAALKHFTFSVKTSTDWLDLQRALDNYLKSDRVKRGFIQNGSTWFNNWRDWINYTENGGHYAGKSGIGGNQHVRPDTGKYAAALAKKHADSLRRRELGVGAEAPAGEGLPDGLRADGSGVGKP